MIVEVVDDVEVSVEPREASVPCSGLSWRISFHPTLFVLEESTLQRSGGTVDHFDSWYRVFL